MVAEKLMREVERVRPDLYDAILRKIRPHGLDKLIRLFDCHLRRVHLDVFNQHRENIPEFVWAFVKRAKFPVPGDPFGIQLTCRITRLDTQDTLDSKHLSSSSPSPHSFNVDKAISNELNLFSSQIQVFELANRHEYATVYLRDDMDSLDIPDTGLLKRGGPLNMAKNARGEYKYVTTFRFVVVVEDDGRHSKILYRSSKDLNLLLTRYLNVEDVVAFSDIRYVYNKCGITCFFFNLLEIVRRQLFRKNDDPVYEKDVTTVMKYQCRSGIPLPLTRDGLVKNPDRTPIEILSFEAPKKNYARLSTSSPMRGKWIDVESSSDKIFYGQQFNEGTGYSFALLPKEG
jgi:hypothetical protein